MTDTRLVVRRKIADTLYGEVLECEFDTSPAAAGSPAQSNVVVAVKHICLDLAAEMQNDQALNRQLDDPMQEFRVARSMMDAETHPNIVYPFTQIVQDGDLYLVFEYCGGGDLFALLEAHKSTSGLPEKQTLGFMKQVFEGVRYLHEQVGIAHRDLSLENILLSDGVCKISDFALSVDTHGTPCSLRAGKDFYMAPEVVANENYDPVKADIWSLGVMWFILLTGSRLVPIASREDKNFLALEQHGVSAVLDKWGYSQRVSPATTSLLSRMLCVDPSERVTLSEILASPVLGEGTCYSP
jgi:calcium-dependent protein kinase